MAVSYVAEIYLVFTAGLVLNQGGSTFSLYEVDCKTLRESVFLRIQVGASSQTKGVARFARVRLLRHALPISLLILSKNRLFCSLVRGVQIVERGDQTMGSEF